MKPVVLPLEDIPAAKWAEGRGVVVLHFSGQALAAMVDWAELENRVCDMDSGFERGGVEDGERIITVRWAVRMALLDDGINTVDVLHLTILNAAFLLLFDPAEEDTSDTLFAASRPVLHVSLDQFNQVNLRGEDAALVPTHSSAELRRPAIH